MILPFIYASGREAEFSIDRLSDGTARIAFRGSEGHYSWRNLARHECVKLAKLLLEATDGLTCSFCGKSQHDVRKLIAGPSAMSICDECVALCNGIIRPHEPTA